MQEKRLFRVSGYLMIIAGLLVAATLPLIPIIIPSLAPSSAQAGLVSLESQGLVYGVTWVLYLVSDIFYLVAFFGLYYALRRSGLNAAKVFVVLNTVFVGLDVGVDIPLRLWLLLLSSSYASATSNAQQILDSANFAISASNLIALVATLFQFSALIIASYLMRRSSPFGKRVGYLGIATGIVALLFIPAFVVSMMLAGVFNIAGFALLVVWSVLAGVKLRKLSDSGLA